MDNFYSSWKDGVRSKAKNLERLKGFIRFCLKRKWLAENIADDLEAPAGSSVLPNKMPFAEAELKHMFDACDALVRWPHTSRTGTPCLEWRGCQRLHHSVGLHRVAHI